MHQNRPRVCKNYEITKFLGPFYPYSIRDRFLQVILRGRIFETKIIFKFSHTLGRDKPNRD